MNWLHCLSLSLSLSHTHTHTHARTHAHTHTHTNSTDKNNYRPRQKYVNTYCSTFHSTQLFHSHYECTYSVNCNVSTIWIELFSRKLCASEIISSICTKLNSSIQISRKCSFLFHNVSTAV